MPDNKGFKLYKIAAPDIFDKLPVKAFFTTKLSGMECIFKGQRLRDDIAKILNVRLEGAYLPIQKHTDKVLIVDHDFEPKIADAVVTNRKGVLLGVQVADCIPILLYDAKKGVAGAVHAGWRGTASGILKKAIKVMADGFYSLPHDILIAIGPGIRWCCYDVGHEVIEAVEKVTSYRDSPRFTDAPPLIDWRGRIGTVAASGVKSSKDYIIKKGEKYCLDLPTANKYQALSLGVPLENIWISDECTFCLPEKYYSYRYAKGTTGRQCGFIGIV